MELGVSPQRKSRNTHSLPSASALLERELLAQMVRGVVVVLVALKIIEFESHFVKINDFLITFMKISAIDQESITFRQYQSS